MPVRATFILAALLLCIPAYGQTKAAETNSSASTLMDLLDRVQRLPGPSSTTKQRLERQLRGHFGNWNEYRNLREASRAGDPDAAFKLGSSIYRVTRQNRSRHDEGKFSQAAWWFIVSAKNGNWESLGQLAEMILAGLGVEENPYLALEMYRYLASVGETKANGLVAQLEKKLGLEAKSERQQAENDKLRSRIRWHSRLGAYETITSLEPYFFEEERHDIVPFLPDESIIIVSNDIHIDVTKAPGKLATYSSNLFNNILFIRQEYRGDYVYLAQFSEKATGITYYALFETYPVRISDDADEKTARDFFVGQSYLYLNMFDRGGRRRAGRGYVDAPSGLEDKLAKKYPDAFAYAEVGGQIIRNYDWSKLPANNIADLLDYAQGIINIRQLDGTVFVPDMVVVDKNNSRDMDKYAAMREHREIQIAKINARPELNCQRRAVTSRFSEASNLAAELSRPIVGSRGTILPKLKCDGNWCYATTGPGTARISLLPVGTPDCDPLSETRSECTFSTEFGAGVAGSGMTFDNPIATAIIERAIGNQPLGSARATFDLEECVVVGPLEYTNERGETFVFN